MPWPCRDWNTDAKARRKPRRRRKPARPASAERSSRQKKSTVFPRGISSVKKKLFVTILQERFSTTATGFAVAIRASSKTAAPRSALTAPESRNKEPNRTRQEKAL